MDFGVVPLGGGRRSKGLWFNGAPPKDPILIVIENLACKVFTAEIPLCRHGSYLPKADCCHVSSSVQESPACAVARAVSLHESVGIHPPFLDRPGGHRSAELCDHERPGGASFKHGEVFLSGLLNGHRNSATGRARDADQYKAESRTQILIKKLWGKAHLYQMRWVLVQINQNSQRDCF